MDSKNLQDIDQWLQLVNHFDIHTHLLEQVLLVDVESNKILWEDSELSDYGAYFLAFTRLGSRIACPESVATFLKELPCDTSLLEKALFARRGRQFRIKASSTYPLSRIDDLELQKRRGNPFGLVCPLLDCSRDFKRSGDLTVHFSVETGFKPFQCKECGASFRRRILLAHHAFYHDCERQPQPVQRKRKSLAEKLAPEAFDLAPNACLEANLPGMRGESSTLASPDTLIRLGINSLYSGIGNQIHSLEAGSPLNGQDLLGSHNASILLANMRPLSSLEENKEEASTSPVSKGILFLQLRQIIKNRLSFEFLQKKLETSAQQSNELLIARLLMCQQLLDTSKLLQTELSKVE